jgi:MYXO-CTERM domain-containing protein
MGGCNVDADCAAGHWCEETMHVCTATLSNGTAIPNDPDHTNPGVTGTCSTAVGTLVCTSGVCSTANSECGYSDGEGICTVANGPMLCQSGVCSNSGTCEAPMTCNVDADCATGQWCNEGMHTCKPTLANGQMIPSDPTHTNPSLGGTCTAGAGTLVCTSGVCSTANSECGFTNGEGPCTVADGPMVCQSGVCGNGATCGPSVTDGGVPDGGNADGGLHDGGGVDSGAHDSGLVLDGSSSPDSAIADDGGSEGDAANEDAGVVEGGGCSVGSTQSASGNSLAGALASLAVFGMVASRRRRRRLGA